MLDFFRVVPKKRKVKIHGKKGLIYHNPHPVRKFLFHLGSILLLAAVIYLIYLYYPLLAAVFRYQTDQVAVAPPPPPKIENFYVFIPKIGAIGDVKINIDPFNPEEYLPILDQNLIAQAKGTNLPNEGKGTTTYLFAHSSQQGLSRVRNNSVFYLLGELEKGDLIYLKTADQAFVYVVYDKKIVNPKEISYIYDKEDDKELLILQTCWPIGTDWKRLLVYAARP